MADCIDREAVLAEYDRQHKGLPGGARKIIAEFPAADVVPVVRCKDCIHSVKGKWSLECERHRYMWNNMNRLVNEDDFCCWGIQRETR